MSAPPDYYRILHVQPDAPTAVIHAIYRTLLQRLQTSATFAGEADPAMIEEAYAVLGNAQRRAAYDAQRRSASARPAPPREVPAVDEHSETLVMNQCLFCSGGSSATTIAAAVEARYVPQSGTGSNTRASAC